MNKIKRRAVSALIVAFIALIGLGFYIFSFIEHGADWAGAFSANNSTGTCIVTDRNGVTLATEKGGTITYSDDKNIRLSCYHVLGDPQGNIGTGVISNFSGEISGFSYINGTYNASDSSFALTIDSNLNEIAYNAMAGRNGAVIVSNYKTGEILCMVSTPSQDPTNPSENPPDGTYLNKCISSTLTPGSTFKLITTIAAIENVDGIYDKTFTCNGSVDISDVTVKCTGTHGTQTISQALANSCNCAFAEITQLVGSDTLSKYVSELGFTSEHSLDGIVTAAGRFDSAPDGSGNLSWSGIGQYNDLVCPYSMLRLVSSIANGGKITEPTLIGHSSLSLQTTMLNSDTADKMKEFMKNNVVSSYGTGTFPGLEMCAKSGTAETGTGTSHSWFTGFLDDEDHPYAFVVVIENGGGGLANAGAVANTVLQSAVN